MANKLPPAPVGVPPGHSFWNDWYEKIRTLVNSTIDGITWTTISGTPTTMSGYGIEEVDIEGDVIVDDATKGLVLKDTQGTPHYWRVTIDNTGTLVITDLGTTKP
jgi:hypothetical protein